MSDEPESSPTSPTSPSVPPRNPWAPPEDRPIEDARPSGASGPSAGPPSDAAGAPVPPPLPPGAVAPEPGPYSGLPPQPPYPQYPGAQPGYGAGYAGYAGYSGYPMDPYGGWPPFSPRNGFGVTALVLGIVGVILAFACVGILLGIAAVVFGIIGVRMANRGEANNRGQAVTGLILGAVSIVLAGVMIALFAVGAANGAFDDDTGSSRHSGSTPAYDSPLPAGATMRYDDGLEVTVSVARPADMPSWGAAQDRAVRFTVKVRNNGPGVAYVYGMQINAYEDGGGEEPLQETTDNAGFPNSLDPGASGSTQIVVIIPASADGPVDVEVAAEDGDSAYWLLKVPDGATDAA